LASVQWTPRPFRMVTLNVKITDLGAISPANLRE
jgi:hypothetical protein